MDPASSPDIEWLHQARLRELRDKAGDLGVVKSGSVEEIRRRLIMHLHLPGIDLSPEGLKQRSLAELTDICRLFGIKRSGSIKEKRQRIWLHAHHDPATLTIDHLDAMSRDELHEICQALGLPRSGTKTQLFGRLAGVLTAQDGGWGRVKKSLRRPKPERRLVHDGRTEAAARLASGPAAELVMAAPEAVAPEPAMPEPAAAVVTAPPPDPAAVPAPTTAPIEAPLSRLRQPAAAAGGAAPPAVASPPAAVSLGPVEPQPTAVPAPSSVQEALETTAPLGSGPTSEASVLHDGLATSEQRLQARQRIAAFVEAHADGWDFEQEASLRAELADVGLPMLDGRMIDAVAEWTNEAVTHARASREADTVRVGSPEALERAQNLALRQVELRLSELWANLREFLFVGDLSDVEDRNSLLHTLRTQGFRVDLPAIRQRVERELLLIQGRIAEEGRALDTDRATWEDAAALAELERARPELQAFLDDLIESGEVDRARQRVLFEERAAELNIPLASPAVSGRLHALFDIEAQLRNESALSDPVLARRARASRMLQHRTGELSATERNTVKLLAEDVSMVEQLVEAIVRRHDGAFGPAQHALLVRSLERRGLQVNTPQLRPRVVAAAGVIAAELGFVDPSDIPELATFDGGRSHEREVMRSLRALVQRLASDKHPYDADSGTEAPPMNQRGSQVERARQRIVDIDRLLERVGGPGTGREGE